MVRSEERIGILLKERGLRISLAESCTGGLIAKRITDIPGASDYFEMAIVSYSNKAKERFLGVPADILASKGAVSGEVARLMAEGVRNTAGTDLGLALTGIAGPGGGTPEKPVGTVYVSLAGPGVSIVRRFLFMGNRDDIRQETCSEALAAVLKYLEEEPV
jgi:PncC family amidohydrolase